MRKRRKVEQLPKMEELWTGAVDFDVLTHTGSSLGPAQLLVDREQVKIRFSGRDLAVLARDRVREWLRRPVDPIVADDVVLASRGQHLTLAIGMAPPQDLPGTIVTQLRAVI
jgi:hypothetical protein